MGITQVTTLNQKQKARILDRIKKAVLKHHFNVSGIDYPTWTAQFDSRRPALLEGDVESFENGVKELLVELRSSHTGFYHERPNRLFPQHTINATLKSFELDGGPVWFFLDIFQEGPADVAGIKSGEILWTVDGKDYIPPDFPPFRLGQTHQLTVSNSRGEQRRTLTLSLPSRKGSKSAPPMLEPKAISTVNLAPGVGLLRITWFPGSMGLGFSAALDKAISELKANGCDRLIIDLRGNLGGGLGFARLCSYLCPDKRPIGYSLTPKRQRRGYELHKLEHVMYPNNRLQLAERLTRFAFKDKSIFLLTQGLGAQPFHGRISILVNEWTNSAAEMVVAFAAENGLATIVGEKTAGNVLGAISMKVGSGYFLRLPIFGWHTTSGPSLEGVGVQPTVRVTVDPEGLTAGDDSQLSEAILLTSHARMNQPEQETVT
jgi:carboxyl-terminal processing protease